MDGAVTDETVATNETAAAADEAATPRLGAGLVLLLAVGWYAATMWSAQLSITGDDAAVAISAAALALPAVIGANLLLGAGCALATVAWIRRDGSGRRARLGRWTNSAARRLMVGVATGVGCGVVTAALVMIGYGSNTAVLVIALTAAGAATLGGAGAAMPSPVLGASVAGLLGVQITSVVVNFFATAVKSMFGADGTAAGEANAAYTFTFLSALLAAIVAGVAAFAYLRRQRRASMWPSYLVAGAMPGIALLATEVLTVLGGSQLLDLVGDLSAMDHFFIAFLDRARINQGLIIAFGGAVAALVLVGRTLRPTGEPEAGLGGHAGEREGTAADESAGVDDLLGGATAPASEATAGPDLVN